ncbi:MAG: hypothetical protein B6V02_03200 [Thermoprotei archaeon ex4572_64]|nr:MAG: hypothetical protein B6V02_03200 [Thermoprotei archaeon ex4572_64]
MERRITKFLKSILLIPSMRRSDKVYLILNTNQLIDCTFNELLSINCFEQLKSTIKNYCYILIIPHDVIEEFLTLLVRGLYSRLDKYCYRNGKIDALRYYELTKLVKTASQNIKDKFSQTMNQLKENGKLLNRVRIERIRMIDRVECKIDEEVSKPDEIDLRIVSIAKYYSRISHVIVLTCDCAIHELVNMLRSQGYNIECKSLRDYVDCISFC